MTAASRTASGVAHAALHQRLRTETRSQHERIESVVPLLRPDLDRPRYARYLEAIAGYYRPFEERLGAIEGWAEVGIDFDRRRKVALLDRDLRALDRREAIATAAALPRASTLPRAAGCLYVVEGSTLGSRVLARHVDATLGIGPSDGAAFLHGYGEETRAMWMSFTEALDRLSARRGFDAREVIDAAVETFETLEDWLRSREIQ